MKKNLPSKQIQLKGSLAACLFFVTFFVQAADPVQNPIVRGYVLNAKDSTGVSQVHIINLDRAWGTTSTHDGSFNMRMAAGDRILFRALGFYSDTLQLSASELQKIDRLEVLLQEQVYELPMVEVYPYATFTDFKYAFLNLKDPEPPIDLRLPAPASVAAASGQGGIVIDGPITYIYDRFSRRGREMARYQELRVQSELERRASSVVNVALVKRYTGLQSDREVYDFLEYCNITPEFVLSRKEFEVYQALLLCYDQYCKEKE